MSSINDVMLLEGRGRPRICDDRERMVFNNMMLHHQNAQNFENIKAQPIHTHTKFCRHGIQTQTFILQILITMPQIHFLVSFWLKLYFNVRI